MITTEDACRIAKIIWDGGPKDLSKRIPYIVHQIELLPDAVRVNFDSVSKYLSSLYYKEPSNR